MLSVLCVGKTREAWIKQGVAEYKKRLAPAWKLEWKELSDVSLKLAGSVNEVKKREAAILSKAILPDACLIALDEHGTEYASKELSLKLMSLMQDKDVNLVIGGVFGLAESILNRADLVLSLSRLTMPHQLVRVVLLEQLYRAWTIQQGKTYHY